MSKQNFYIVDPLFIEHTKRYVVFFNLFNLKLISKSITEYDNLKDAEEEIKLLKEFYKDSDNVLVSDENSKFGSYRYYGYFLLDFETEKILKSGGTGLFIEKINRREFFKGANKLWMKDIFFRKKDEIPEDYKWSSDAEYAGWLLYRWDRNSYNQKFGLVPKKKSEKKSNDNSEDIVEVGEYDDIQDRFDDYLDKENISRKEFKW